MLEKVSECDGVVVAFKMAGADGNVEMTEVMEKLLTVVSSSFTETVECQLGLDW